MDAAQMLEVLETTLAAFRTRRDVARSERQVAIANASAWNEAVERLEECLESIRGIPDMEEASDAPSDHSPE